MATSSHQIVNLVVVAHPDDEILGFGATGAKFAARGETVQPLILSGKVDLRRHRPGDAELAADIDKACNTVGFAQPRLGEFPNIAMNALPQHELVKFIEQAIEDYAPTRIFTHHPGDLNSDHVAIAGACLAAARLPQRHSGSATIRSVHFMEILSATDWAFPVAGPPFQPTDFVEIGEFLDTKLAALACYRNVMRPFPHPRSDEAVRGLAAVRGAQCGLGLAEAFQTVFNLGMN